MQILTMIQKPIKKQSNRSAPAPANLNDFHNSFRASLKQQLSFEVTIKRQSHFFSQWKKRYTYIHYDPGSELSLTIKNKEKGEVVEEILNLRNTKISKRCSVVEGHHCFGLEIATGKRYLMGRDSESKTLVLFENLTRLKKYFKQPVSTTTNSKKNSYQVYEEKFQDWPKPQKLQFERSSFDFQNESQKDIQNLISTKVSPTKRQTYALEFERLSPEKAEKPRMMQEEPDEDYCTVMEEQPLPPLPDTEQPQQKDVHLRVPLSSEELNYLENDQGFKLKENFNEGRILTKHNQVIKINLLLKTHLNEFEMLEAFFHIQLWNDRVKKYELLNRIDEGIYLVYMQLHKTSFWSTPKYTYLMATAVTIQTEPCLILKSLNKSDFESPFGHQWIDLTLWVKIRGSESINMVKFLTLCLKVEDYKHFQLALQVINQVKMYQSFLLTTQKLPCKVLSWRKQTTVILPL